MNEPSERKLDPAVVAALFVEHAEELRRFLVGILRDPNTAADALQATFSKALERGHMAREETQKGWLFRVAYNEAIVIKRRQAVEARAVNTLGAGGERVSPLPEASLSLQEEVRRVQAALETLPAEQRQVVRLRIYEEKKFAEIAAELNVPLGTVLTRMQAALKKLRKALEG
ncbi:MAG: RNA polymerase sigma factor [Planctomycetia bacterium]|nr:RNA polymerase sigma factor [Planctomycetia bacterium]